jgi:FlaA1/EpsC-like NDP-sugar epimerase
MAVRRLANRTLKTAVDAALLLLAFGLAFGLRFDWAVPADMAQRGWQMLPYVVLLQLSALYLFQVPRLAWRFVSLREVSVIGQAVLSATALLLAVRLGVHLAPRSFVARHAFLPTGVILIDAGLAFALVVGVRVVHRSLSERRAAQRAGREKPRERVRTLLVGAGEGGVMVARQIEARPDLGLLAVGFVDDDAQKVGTVLAGLPVLGATSDLAQLAEQHEATQALVTFKHATGRNIRRVVELCERAGIKAKIIPGLHAIVGGQINLSRPRDVAIEDLLRREPVRLDEGEIAAGVSGKVVMVTGAGGSIGSELCRQICRFGPAKLVLVERAENALFHVHRELGETFPEVELVPCIADLGDGPRMRALFAGLAPALVFHAAAHKHVPMMEWNPGEAVKNNVLATKGLADLSSEHGVERFVMISTDKAVNPTSVMGATKRAAEIYVQALSERSRTRFVTVRFGNVLGSNGSVVPVFQEQIARGGPVTVTHPDMRRYFMTIPEASQLVLQAATMGRGGEIFILDMGEPVRIVDLATDLIVLSGLKPGEDIEIRFSGVRPGEKLFEELSVAEELADKTRHPKIFVGRLRPLAWDVIEARIEALASLGAADAEAIKRELWRLVPEYVGGAPEAAVDRASRPSTEIPLPN